jgi:hypothetical protein
MKNLRHPNVILAIISFIILFIGIGLYANGYEAAYYVVGFSLFLGAIHYIWSVIDVSKTTTLTSSQKVLWFIIVLIIPGAGSLLYYFIHSHNKQLD